jgi:hypothetical protein
MIAQWDIDVLNFIGDVAGEPPDEGTLWATQDYVTGSIGAMFERDENGDLWVMKDGARINKIT